MKPINKTIFLTIMVLLMFSNTHAQTTHKKTSTTQKSKPKSTASKPAPVAYGKEVQFTLKNLAEGTVPIFAGPKEDLKDITKRKTVGGLGTNKMFLRVNEIVCILKGDKTVSCATVKANTTQMEINISANEITVK